MHWSFLLIICRIQNWFLKVQAYMIIENIELNSVFHFMKIAFILCWVISHCCLVTNLLACRIRNPTMTAFFWKDSLYFSKSGSFIHFHSFRIRTRANFPRLTIKINSEIWQKKWVWIWEFNLFIICKTISYWKKKWLLILLVENQFDMQFF